MRGFLYLSAPHSFLTVAPEVHWMQLPSIRAGKCVWFKSEVVGGHLPSCPCRPPLVSLWCCSAVLLGLGELRLEPVLGGEETVPSQHRDESHDLRSLPLAHKTQHRRSQGKKSTFRLDALVVSASFRAFVAPLLITIMKAVRGLFTSSVVLTTVWFLNNVSELSMKALSQWLNAEQSSSKSDGFGSGSAEAWRSNNCSGFRDVANLVSCASTPRSETLL